MSGRDTSPRSRERWWSSLGRQPVAPVFEAAPERRHDRPVAAFAALDRALGVRRTQSLFRESTGRSGQRCAHLWPFSRAAAAALDLVELGALPVERAEGILGEGLGCYRRGDGVPPAYDSAARPPLGPGGDRFYDDNAWVGLDLIRLHRLTGDPATLDRAAEVFAFLVSGWQDDPDLPRPGGVAWVESPTNSDRNTVSTAPAAQLGFLLHGLGAGGGDVVAWAERMLAWVRDVLRDPADGLFWDHIDAGGTIELTKWSYNQGNVIGAELARHALRDGGVDGGEATGALSRAEAVAVAALDHYDSVSGGLSGQGLAFNAIFFRNLLELGAAAGAGLGSRIRETVVGHADEVWRTRCGGDGLVLPERRGGAVTLLDQAAMVEIQALAASAANRGGGPVSGPPPSSPGLGDG